MVRKLVDQQLGPVFTEEVKGHEDLRLRFQATSCESQMDEFYQTTAFGERWLIAGEPVCQVKLEKAQTGICNLYDVLKAFNNVF